MKRYGSFFKNIAAIVMLLGLLSLLLPVCKITTSQKASTVSGLQVAKIGVDLGYEYYKNGTIENSYVVVDTITWGEVKGQVNAGVQNKSLKKVAVAGTVISLPVLFCFLAMIFTFMAGGKIAMILPTILLGIASFETAVGVGGFSKIQELLLQNTGIVLSLQMGLYIFLFALLAALGILLVLWVTGGFNRPIRKERHHYDSDAYDYEDDEDDDKEDGKKRRRKRKKDKPSRKEKRRKKSRREKKKERKRGKAERKTKNNKSNENSNAAQKNTAEGQDVSDERVAYTGGTGHLAGLNGMYQGANMDLSNNQASTVTIGTTQEAVDALSNNSLAALDKLEGNTCDICFDPTTRRYTVTSHSVREIILQNGSAAEHQTRLNNGDSIVVDGETLLYIGDFQNILKLT